jgi:hypothetical protein
MSMGIVNMGALNGPQAPNVRRAPAEPWRAWSARGWQV